MTIAAVLAIVAVGVVYWTRGSSAATAAGTVTITGTGLPPDVTATRADLEPPDLPPDVFVAAEGYELTPSGPLGATATVAFPVGDPPRSGDEPVVVTSESAAGPWVPLDTAYDAEAGTATVETDHFSFFMPIWNPAGRFVDALRSIAGGLTGGFAAEPDAASCRGEASDYDLELFGDAFSACLGTYGAAVRPAVTLVNLRRYPIVVGPMVGEAELADTQFDLAATLSRLGLGNDHAVVPAAGSVHYYLTDSVGLYGEFDGAANSLNTLFFGVSLAGDFLTRFGYGASGTALDVGAALATVPGCLNALGAGADPGALINSCFGYRELAEAFGVAGAFLAIAMKVGSVVAFFRGQLNAFFDELNHRDEVGVLVNRGQTAPGVAEPPPAGSVLLSDAVLDYGGVGISGAPTSVVVSGREAPESTTQWVGCDGSPAWGEYALNGHRQLTAWLGLRDFAPPELVVAIRVLVDGTLVEELTLDADGIDVDLALPAGTVLRLEAVKVAGTCGAASEGYAVWGNGALS